MLTQSVNALIQTALNEDIGSGDITTDNLIDPKLTGRGILMAKEPMVLAGMDIARQVFQHLAPTWNFRPCCQMETQQIPVHPWRRSRETWQPF